MRKEIILPAVAVAGGAVGFGLRRWGLATAFEPETGLAIPGAPATWALVLFSLAAVALLALLCCGKHPAFEGYDQAFAAKGNTLYMCAMVAGAFLMAISGVLCLAGTPSAMAELQAHTQGRVHAFELVPRALLGVLSLASCWGLLTQGRNNYRGEGHGKYSSSLLIPAYTCFLWLITAYQARSRDPVVLDYVYQLLAIIAAVLAAYFMAGFAFERAKVFRVSFFGLVAVYFTLVTLADHHELYVLLLLAGFSLYFTASLTALLFNAHRPLGPRMPGVDNKETDTITREETPDEG